MPRRSMRNEKTPETEEKGSFLSPSSGKRRKMDSNSDRKTATTFQKASLEEQLEISNKKFKELASDPNHAQSYQQRRTALVDEETKTFWDAQARKDASDVETEAAKILFKIREHERETSYLKSENRHLFGNKPSEDIPGPNTRDMGGQFLTNKDRINNSKLFAIAQEMPKGCHLHLHFNAELDPQLLIERARQRPNMFIRSTRPLTSDEAYDTTEVVFDVLPEKTPPTDIFSDSYVPDWKSPDCRPWMNWSDFREQFSKRRNVDVEEWVKDKMVLTEKTVYDKGQTVNGIWARFNQGTRAFKGLMNYESMFRWYVGNAIDSMIAEKIMYCELRPMLMDKSIPSDDGMRRIYHEEQMDIILEEVKKKQDQLREQGKLDQFPFGVKIIYCTPRSIPKSRMQIEIQDAIKLKLKYPNLMCGFDLVGAEDRPNHIGFYMEELVSMQKTCTSLGIEMPFLFHAGETLLDTGGSRHPENSNLFDCVLLNAKRIGHGFSLLKHPELITQFKEKEICIELCPVSNELLHLCRCVKEHPYPELLAAGIPCTVNADNPCLFRGVLAYSSSLSHEFYQVMVGTPTMSIHGWKQLALWSIQYSCLKDEEKVEAVKIFRRDWENFCKWILDEYGEYTAGLDIE